MPGSCDSADTAPSGYPCCGPVTPPWCYRSRSTYALWGLADPAGMPLIHLKEIWQQANKIFCSFNKCTQWHVNDRQGLLTSNKQKLMYVKHSYRFHLQNGRLTREFQGTWVTYRRINRQMTTKCSLCVCLLILFTYHGQPNLSSAVSQRTE